MTQQTLPANFLIDKDHELVFTAVDKSSQWIVPFKPFGSKWDSKPASLEAYEFISEFSKAELFLFHEACRHALDDNLLSLRMKRYRPHEKAKLRKAIPLWIEKGLIVRIKREHYMVNPWFIVPQKKDMHSAAIRRWNMLKTKKPGKNKANRSGARVVGRGSRVP